MKNKPLFVNISRSGVVNENDLIEAFKLGVLNGTALDILTDELPCL